MPSSPSAVVTLTRTCCWFSGRRLGEGGQLDVCASTNSIEHGCRQVRAEVRELTSEGDVQLVLMVVLRLGNPLKVVGMGPFQAVQHG